MKDEIEEIKIEFKSEDIDYIDAIERLEKIGIGSMEAEDMVNGWEK